MRFINALVQEQIDTVIESIIALMAHYKVFTVGYSGGKDSSVLLDITIKAMQIASKRGISTPVMLVHTNNTGVENPEIRMYVQDEFNKIRDFSFEQNLDIILSVGLPSLTDHWAVSIMSGRKLPTYPDKSTADCSIDYKIKPGAKTIKKHLAKMGLNLSDNIFLLGTRLDESTKRKKNMEARGESHQTIAKNSKTGDSFAPIAMFDDELVWGYLLTCSTDKHMRDETPMRGYSDFEETNRIYADAQEEGCHLFGDGGAPKKGCGARHGCWSCTKVSDNQSLRAMIEKDEKYQYMRSTLNVQKFLIATQYNWEYRNPVHRSISTHGLTKVQPDTLHPKVLEKLFLACLTIDRDSAEEASVMGFEEPRIEQILSLERIAYIDAIWSLKGFFKPFHAWDLVKRIYSYEESFYFPDDIDKVEKTKIPKTRYLDLRQHYAEMSESGKGRIWKQSFSVRDDSLFLEDGDHYDSQGNDYLAPDLILDPDLRVLKMLEKSVKLDITHLGKFLEKQINCVNNGRFSLWKVADSDLSFKEEFRFSDRTTGFIAYLQHGILQYPKSQKGWIENTVALTRARALAFGQWDIPTYSEAINMTLGSIPEELRNAEPELEVEAINDDNFSFDFGDLDEINVVNVTPKPKKRLVTHTTSHKAEEQMMLF
tara:strand:+ start:39539 stop:41497 length:1959 start_codon:yes stop_codon:yes gene_type:complete